MKDYTKLSDTEKQGLVQKAISAAHDYEQKYSNCGQCCLAGLSDAFPDLGIDDKIFKSAFGFGGGYGQATIGTCGALNGAAMAISIITGRERSDMANPPQFCYDLAYKILKEFEAKYGGIRCCDVQKSLFGKCFVFREKGEGDGYAAAGGHDKCATVVGTAAGMVAKLIVNGELK